MSKKRQSITRKAYPIIGRTILESRTHPTMVGATYSNKTGLYATYWQFVRNEENSLEVGQRAQELAESNVVFSPVPGIASNEGRACGYERQVFLEEGTGSERVHESMILFCPAETLVRRSDLSAAMPEE